jgi:hypothetical protein
MLETDQTETPVGAPAWRRWGQAALWLLAVLVILAIALY